MNITAAEKLNARPFVYWTSDDKALFVKALEPDDLQDDRVLNLAALHFTDLKKPMKDAAIAFAVAARQQLTVDGRRDAIHIARALKQTVHSFYDMQEIRLQVSGRVYDKPGDKPIQLHPVDIIKLHAQVQQLEAAEKRALDEVKQYLAEMPFYTEVLSDKTRFKGIGPTMAGVILSEFDVSREPHVSNMWSFAGLAPVNCYRCATCHVPVKEEGLPENGDDQAYVHEFKTEKTKKGCKEILYGSDLYTSGKAAKGKKGEKLKYNAWLRTKLCGVLGPILLKCNSPYRKHYDEYKHRKATAGWGINDAHRHNAAIRYMVKMLLLDIWIEWRKHLGLEVTPTYHEAKQGGHGYKAKVETGVHTSMEDAQVEEELRQLEG